MNVLLKELDEEKGRFGRIDQAIATLRDEVSTVNFTTSNGHNRLLSLVVAKLDEAEGLALIAAKNANRIAVVDRKEILQGLTDETDTTVTGMTANV